MITDNNGWEMFDYAGASKSDKRPLISLQLRGSFQINRAAHELMGSPSKVHLLFNRNKRLIGFKEAKEGEPATYNVRKALNSSTYVVSAQAFTNHYDLKVTETRRYEAKKDGDIVAIDLNVPEAASSRAAKALRNR